MRLSVSNVRARSPLRFDLAGGGAGVSPRCGKRALASGDFRRRTGRTKTAPGIDDAKADGLYDAATRAGDWAGKASGAGAGAGGLRIPTTDPEDRYRRIAALNAADGRAGPVKPTFDGAEGWSQPQAA